MKINIQKIKPYETEGVVYHADTCLPLIDAVKRNKLKFKALARHTYPGDRLDQNTIGLNSIGYWDGQERFPRVCPVHCSPVPAGPETDRFQSFVATAQDYSAPVLPIAVDNDVHCPNHPGCVWRSGDGSVNDIFQGKPRPFLPIEEPQWVLCAAWLPVPSLSGSYRNRFDRTGVHDIF